LDDFKSQLVEISANKLNHRIKGHTNDEFGTLANSFNSMIERLGFAFKSQKEFTVNASHELKTPLTRISFQIEGMLENYTHDSEVFNYLTNIKSEVHQMSSLINTLLLLSKIENGERSIDFETLRIDELIFSGFEELKKLDDSYDLQFEIIEGDDSEIEKELYGIKPLIQIAINNLLKNAFQYSSDGIAVVKIVSQETNKLLVVIENKGPIITEKEQTKLFGSFTRGANSQNTKGYGLGLRIAKRILELHEAELSYESENPMLNSFIIRFEI